MDVVVAGPGRSRVIHREWAWKGKGAENGGGSGWLIHTYTHMDGWMRGSGLNAYGAMGWPLEHLTAQYVDTWIQG